LGGAVALSSGALVVYLAFNAAGYFPNTQGLVALLLLVGLAAWVAFVEDPFAGISPLLALAAGALAAFAIWTLLSGGWSEAGSRAALEFNRALLYLAALLLFGLAVREERQIQWFVWSLAAGIAFVCVVALTTRVLPDVWPTDPNVANERLSYPTTYWNALGLLGALGILLSLHMTTRARGAIAPRVLGAGAIPLLAATVYFTFSRGAILAGVVGIGAYLALARTRGTASGLLATTPSTVIAVVAAYNADLLATETPTTPAAVEQGQDLAPILIACAIAAAVIRAALLRLDRRATRMRPLDSKILLAGAGVTLAAVVAVALALDAPDYIDRQYDRFTNEAPIETGGDLRSRLTQAGPNGRLDYWEVAIDEFEREELTGEGAGTFQLAWERERPYPGTVADAHGLYQEVLGELGIVGIVLLGVALGSILVGFALRTRGPSRPLFAVLFAAAMAWALRAALDWDWEMPAVTLWLFAAGGMALAVPAGRRRWVGPRPPLALRLALALPLLLVAALPYAILSSQAWLDRAEDAFSRGDCRQASSDARASIDALASRPDAYELLGYCSIREGRPDRAIGEMQRAIDRDPENWNFHYSLALAQGAAGQDPRPELREAHRLNPLGALAQDAVERFDTEDPANWKQRARELAGRFTSL
jgi:O-antigen ligase